MTFEGGIFRIKRYLAISARSRAQTVIPVQQCRLALLSLWRACGIYGMSVFQQKNPLGQIGGGFFGLWVVWLFVGVVLNRVLQPRMIHASKRERVKQTMRRIYKNKLHINNKHVKNQFNNYHMSSKSAQSPQCKGTKAPPAAAHPAVAVPSFVPIQCQLLRGLLLVGEEELDVGVFIRDS